MDNTQEHKRTSGVSRYWNGGVRGRRGGEEGGAGVGQGGGREGRVEEDADPGRRGRRRFGGGLKGLAGL